MAKVNGKSVSRPKSRRPLVEEAFAVLDVFQSRHVHARGVRTSSRTGAVSTKKISSSTAVRK